MITARLLPVLVGVLLLLVPTLFHGVLAAQCAPGPHAEQARVSYVYDGDTVRLADGRKIRFIGINTPEIGRDGRPSQPFARQARRHLLSLLDGSSQVGLYYGPERTDKYDRTLAHVFVDGQVSLEEELLTAGLATSLAIPPNVTLAPCYARLEAKARAARRGIWSIPAYQGVDSHQLKRNSNGFFIVQGRVQSVVDTPHRVWINLPEHLGIYVPREDLVYFDAKQLKQLAGKKLEVRGWIHPSRGRLRMQLRHPSIMEVSP
jgi:endonuclease YncB( thermonuclease family)